MVRALPLVAATALLVACGPAMGATMLDLTVHSYSGSINDAWFVELDKEGSGTGTFPAFVQLKDGKDADNYEWGYNSDVKGTSDDNLDRGTASTHNHTIRWLDIPLVRNVRTTPGDLVAPGWYAEFRADINELTAGENRYLSLDTVEIWVSDAGDLGATGKYYSTWSALTNTSMIYSTEDTPEYDHVGLNYNLESGSGTGDLGLYIPVDRFNSWVAASGVQNPYVYIVSTWGSYTGSALAHDEGTGQVITVANWGISDGFEEWGMSAVGTHPMDLPEPSSCALFGLGLAGLWAWRRRRQAA
jgi:hypothetical protein